MTQSPGPSAGFLDRDWSAVFESKRAEIQQRALGRGDVVLFGAGYLGRQAQREIERLGYKLVAFVDNDQALWGTEVDGLPVLSPVEASVTGTTKDALWVVTVYTNTDVVEQCRSLGVQAVTCAELSWLHPDQSLACLTFGQPTKLLESEADIRRAASLWHDKASVAEYEAQVVWRLSLDYAALGASCSPREIYFPEDLVRPIDDEVFVDCGAFSGDTIADFIAKRAGHFAQIIAVEPDGVNSAALRDRIKAWERDGVAPVTVEQVAAGSRRATLPFQTTGTAGSAVGSGTEMVQVVPLDEILKGRRPTYIKFDVEGAEKDALLGGATTIRENMPVLAVCLYHKPQDLWELPLLIQSIQPGYRMFLRRYSDECWETVCYAVPPQRVVG
jgi:FkbM family methyltransferase